MLAEDVFSVGWGKTGVMIYKYSCHLSLALPPHLRKVARSWSAQIDLTERDPKQLPAASAQQDKWMEEQYPKLFEKYGRRRRRATTVGGVKEGLETPDNALRHVQRQQQMLPQQNAREPAPQNFCDLKKHTNEGRKFLDSPESIQQDDEANEEYDAPGRQGRTIRGGDAHPVVVISYPEQPNLPVRSAEDQVRLRRDSAVIANDVKEEGGGKNIDLRNSCLCRQSTNFQMVNLHIPRIPIIWSVLEDDQAAGLSLQGVLLIGLNIKKGNDTLIGWAAQTGYTRRGGRSRWCI
ncbi:hypothetical protein FA13DRAFT_1719553 [Coprinellus micaceus]|uniref:Uncharacterized protein n=1 Tax=Coprinellus micaceus TaxID=71717 RepID=A0A4Y7SBB6_COPMI|nr:hypothetical protein FA13DRAFT_1719553 [Coprinellus micaceus]